MKTHILNSVKIVTATALISAGLALTAPAYAISTQSEQVTTKIDIRDLETDRGVKRVYQTLARRAERACTALGMKPIEWRNAEKECAKDLLIDFVEDVDNERLTKYFEKMES